MKFYIIIYALSLFNVCFAHMTLIFPMAREHPLSTQLGLKGNDCVAGPLNKGKNPGKCEINELKFPCGGYSPNAKLVTQLKAGQTLNVSFFSLPFQDSVEFNKEQNRFLIKKDLFIKNHKNDNQGRHNGGTCEFALSYDGGKTYSLIAKYTERCPDMGYDWPIKIPDNAPSCKNGVGGKNLGDCILSCTWYSSSTQEFYQFCSDIEIVGKTTTPLKVNDITRANLPGIFDKKLNIPGEKSKCRSDNEEDGTPGQGKAFCNALGDGPKSEEISANLK